MYWRCSFTTTYWSLPLNTVLCWWGWRHLLTVSSFKVCFNILLLTWCTRCNNYNEQRTADCGMYMCRCSPTYHWLITTHTCDHDKISMPCDLLVLCTYIWVDFMCGLSVLVSITLLQCYMKECILVSALCFIFYFIIILFLCVQHSK